MRKFLISALLSIASLSCLAGVDVNKASAADLDSIKGVGPGTSTKIIEARKTAPFKDWSDLVKRVPGIAEKRAVQLSAQGLTVNGESFKPAYTQAVAKPADRKAASNQAAPATGSR
ncbi:helix-hairpin-helix domain-containing protein [uncultured Hydrogenophaga sp.]|uniref:helix-hairpin-helix domain-containing protein n=1 Tax=uncultured Hydrogenophaga sp. TaxID=199683 RepID=UPI00265D9382|nr:helix-hairpin-helix domain-containing protein [uncultured Hydrogenophaga sp.]